jgi:hypothetical protein
MSTWTQFSTRGTEKKWIFNGNVNFIKNLHQYRCLSRASTYGIVTKVQVVNYLISVCQVVHHISKTKSSSDRISWINSL